MHTLKRASSEDAPRGYDSKGILKEVCSEPRSYIVLSGGKGYRRNCSRHISVKEPRPSQYDADGHQVLQAPTKVNDPIIDQQIKNT